MEEKDKMMPFFQKAVLLERQKREKEDALLTLDYLTIEKPEEEEKIIENTILEEPSIEDSQIFISDQDSVEPMAFVAPEVNLQQNKVDQESIPLDIIQQIEQQPEIEQPQIEQPMPYQIKLPSDMMEPEVMEPQPIQQQPIQQNSNIAYKPNKIEQPMIQVNNEEKPTILKSFWSVGRLVMGILAILVCALIVFQCYKSGAITILMNSKAWISHVAINPIVAGLLLIGGILGIVTHKSTKKIGCILSTVIFGIGAGLGAYEWNNNYNYIRIWAAVALFFALFYLLCSIMNPRKNKS